MIRGTTHEVLITSEPSGATFQLGDQSGTTPAKITVRRSWRDKRFECGLAGHSSTSIQITPDKLMVSDEPGMLIVVIFSSLLIIPGIVDLTTNFDRDYPHKIHASLVLKEAGGLSTVAVTRFRDLGDRDVDKADSQSQPESTWYR
jgi:hypothetical protein